MLSTVLHAESALHVRSGAAGVLAMPGSERIGSGGLGAAASSFAGAFAPDALVDVDGAPTWVMRAAGVDASTALASRSVGADEAGSPERFVS